MKFLVPFFIIVPAVEIGVLLFSGQTIGVFPTVLLILATGVLGAYLAKKQGIDTFRRLQNDMGRGMFIGDALMDGICILIGGLLLLTPGFVTDLTGLILLIPFTRKYVKPALYRFFKRWFRNGNIIIMK